MAGLKHTIKRALVSSGRIAARRRDDSHVAVLCYHSVHPTKGYSSCTPDAFEEHVRWLSQQCDIVPVGRALNAAATNPDRPTVAITFDDGYLDNYEYAYPILKKYDAPASIFLTTDFINRDKATLKRLDSVWRLPQGEVEPMTWDQIREMHENGVEFGAHTVEHLNLALQSNKRVRREMLHSRTVIEKEIGARVKGCSYPFGKFMRHYTRKTASIVRDLGFEYALSVSFRRVQPTDSPWQIPRFYVDHDSTQDLHDKIIGAWDLVGKLQERVPPRIARLVSPIDFSF